MWSNHWITTYYGWMCSFVEKYKMIAAQVPLRDKVATLLQRLEEQPQDYQDCLAIKDSLNSVVDHLQLLSGKTLNVQSDDYEN